MREVRKVKAVTIFPFVEEIVERGQNAKILVTGSSMWPFLRDGIDSVEFIKRDFASLVRGDIVLIRRVSGLYVMHRVYKKNREHFFMVGDAQQWLEGPLEPSQIVAVVSAIWRKNKRISCSNFLWRFLSASWLLLRPFRYLIFKIYRKLRKII